jgi:hypothetical protein
MQTQPNRPQQNKRNDLLLWIVRIRWQNTLNTVSNILTQVRVPAKDESQQPATFTHALMGSNTFDPIHAPSKLALSWPLQAYKLSTNNQNLITNKEACRTLISLLKPQITKIIFINKKIRLTHENHNKPSSTQFCSYIKEQKLDCNLKRLL